MSHSFSQESLSLICREHGLSLMGITDAAPLRGEVARLDAWQREGFAGSMGFMERDPELFVNPTRFLSGVRSIVSVGALYDRSPSLPLPSGHGRVARYAWGRDYHRILKKQLQKVAQRIQETWGGEVKVFTDAVPLLERALAVRSGMGFVGKNTMIIRPRIGSFFLLGEILLSLESPREKLPVINPSCGSCTQCIDGCPTGAIVKEYSIDARKCISYLTIEKTGVLEEWEMKAVGEWILGCDICQEVCPFNHTPLREGEGAELPGLTQEQGVGRSLPLQALLSIRDDAEFLSRFAGTPLMRPGREGVLRNAAAVAANTRVPELIPLLSTVKDADSSEVVRETCEWALTQLQ